MQLNQHRGCCPRWRLYVLSGTGIMSWRASALEGMTGLCVCQHHQLQVGKGEQASLKRERNPHLIMVDPPAWSLSRVPKNPWEGEGMTEGDAWL